VEHHQLLALPFITQEAVEEAQIIATTVVMVVTAVAVLVVVVAAVMKVQLEQLTLVVEVAAVHSSKVHQEDLELLS
jgi:hypothetical protein|tara:strand:+ start:137 stop:364 length:228 start_codon:yes stop_codon:yes gene_type:complete